MQCLKSGVEILCKLMMQVYIGSFGTGSESVLNLYYEFRTYTDVFEHKDIAKC